jgi:ATP-dependent Lhr-like helicase
LPPSHSSDAAAFDLLHPLIQRWIYKEQWTELRDVQAEAIAAITAGTSDILISAPTAAGKTEAAFLPLLSKALKKDDAGIRILYVGPLKALINDQFARLDKLCEDLEIAVNGWHGDISSSVKERIRKNPAGVVLITPESLEALFINHGARIPLMFEGVCGVIIDELHSFIGSERGAQLQSLLHRLDRALSRQVLRIGLSATLGDPALAAEFLRPGGASKVSIIESSAQGAELRTLIVGVEGAEGGEPLRAVAAHVFKKMRGTSNLVFANTRTRVEGLGDLLVTTCEEKGVPIEFGAHHGSLSKELRFDVEARLKTGLPYTAVCTSTLEMGIDIGDIHSIGQVGEPPSVSALRQRVGRSGRRAGESQRLWMYALESQLDEQSSLFDRLRVGLFQQMAMLELMRERWCEPPRDTALHFSTLVQQCLSAVAERGGMSPAALYDLLCHGPFARITKETFIRFLRQLGSKSVLASAEDGVLLPGRVGEVMLAHYSIYTAFQTPAEYRIQCNDQTLGTLPIDFPVHPEGYIVFAARRWRVIEVDEKQKTILVARAKAGKVPIFGGDSPFGTHAVVRQKMRELYTADSTPEYLDQSARHMVEQGRKEYHALELGTRRLLREGDHVWLLLWDGDYTGATLALAFTSNGLNAAGNGFAVEMESSSVDTVKEIIRQMAISEKFPSPEKLLEKVSNLQSEKHDHLLSDDLLRLEWGAKRLDVTGARTLLKTLSHPT